MVSCRRTHTHPLWIASPSLRLPPREASTVHPEAAVGLHVFKLVRETPHVLGNLLGNTGQFRDLDVTNDLSNSGTLSWLGFPCRLFLQIPFTSAGASLPNVAFSCQQRGREALGKSSPPRNIVGACITTIRPSKLGTVKREPMQLEPFHLSYSARLFHSIWS